MRGFIIVTCLAATMSFAHAADNSITAQTLGVITHPIWMQRPTGGFLAEQFPLRARRWAVGGKVTLKCDANSNGRLKGCEVSSEFPTDWDFGSAALKVADRFQLQSTDADGKAVAGRKVDVALNWQMTRVSPGEDATYADRSPVLWTAAPTQQDMANAYPTGAAGVGLVALHCIKGDVGDLEGCIVIAEAPVYRGFDASALKVARLFKVADNSHSHKAGEGVNITIEFYPPTEALWDEDEPFRAAGQSFIARAQFNHLPTAHEFGAFYPQPARNVGESGGAKIGCIVTDTGELSKCVVMSEDPPWKGFGLAALGAAHTFKLKPAGVDGSPNAGRIFRTNLSFKFDRTDYMSR